MALSGVQELDEALAWPRFDSPVWLAIGCCPSTGHVVRSCGFEGDNLLVSEPVHEELETAVPDADTLIVMGWGSSAGYVQRETAFIAVRDGEAIRWELQGKGVPEKLERRRFVRVPCSQRAFLNFAEHSDVPATVVDMGEDGLRCTFDGDIACPASGELTVSFALDQTHLSFKAAVAWWGEMQDDRRQAGLRLMTVGATVADQLRSYIFRLQIEERRRQRELER